jgi:hypothetical protein
MSNNEIKPTQNADTRFVTIRAEIWHALLKIAGRQIDPENAEVHWRFGQVVNPYGVYPDLAAECDCVGRLYFARRSGSRIWIEFSDLPDATRKALWEKPLFVWRCRCAVPF